jgi:hypothetical protein
MAPHDYQKAMDELGIEIASGSMPADAEFMCSADFEVHPASELHVIPTFNHDLGRYVGSFRCTAHYKQAIAETRAGFRADPTEDHGAAILTVFVERGVSNDRLRAIVGGRNLSDAIDAALDALEAGTLKLEP